MNTKQKSNTILKIFPKKNSDPYMDFVKYLKLSNYRNYQIISPYTPVCVYVLVKLHTYIYIYIDNMIMKKLNKGECSNPPKEALSDLLKLSPQNEILIFPCSNI